MSSNIWKRKSVRKRRKPFTLSGWKLSAIHIRLGCFVWEVRCYERRLLLALTQQILRLVKKRRIKIQSKQNWIVNPIFQTVLICCLTCLALIFCLSLSVFLLFVWCYTMFSAFHHLWWYSIQTFQFWYLSFISVDDSKIIYI